MVRFEIVQSDAAKPWHTRIRAGNSKNWYHGQQYTRRPSALKAAAHLIVDLVQPDSHELTDDGLVLIVAGQNRLIEIVDVDERPDPWA